MHHYINKGNKSPKVGFGEGVLEGGKGNENVIVLGADITTSVGLNLFKDCFPERFFSFGIAEQNCMGVAAGLALSNKIPVFSTYAVFSALRTTDQIRVSVCYNNLHVIIGGAHAGISVGPDGATHQALEDIAVLRSLPNMTILSPCDATQTKLAVIAAIEQTNSPVYIRFGREAVPDFTDENMCFDIGTSQELHSGDDLCIIATGNLVWESLRPAYMLKEKGFHVRVINMHTLKPADEKAIIKAARETGAILTAEEHQITGGLGSLVAETVVKHHPVPIEMIGIKDSFGESGQADELMQKYGLTAEHIVEKALELMVRKGNS
ncbi:MAG: transketolase C-terminal domain-containing protein [Bacteroidota bacterium]